jgi:hypothetical protein
MILTERRESTKVKQGWKKVYTKEDMYCHLAVKVRCRGGKASERDIGIVLVSNPTTALGVIYC